PPRLLAFVVPSGIEDGNRDDARADRGAGVRGLRAAVLHGTRRIVKRRVGVLGDQVFHTVRSRTDLGTGLAGDFGVDRDRDAVAPRNVPLVVATAPALAVPGWQRDREVVPWRNRRRPAWVCELPPPPRAARLHRQ